MSHDTSTALEEFRAMILADAGLQMELRSLSAPEAFAGRAAALAHARGLALSRDTIAGALRPDPARIARFANVPLGASPPIEGWLPSYVSRLNATVEWTFFGERPLKEPLFEDSVLQASWTPFNQFARYRTHLSHLPRWSRANPGLAPDGFIFHMSRCGSTLAAQMLAADARSIVISEADCIDAVLNIVSADRHLTPDRRAEFLRAMISALGRKRAALHERYFIKLDSWHMRALPLFRHAFPDVPWIFLYREPSEVLASHIAMPGRQVVPGEVPPAWFGLTFDERLPLERYFACVLAAICEAALEYQAEGSGLLVNYSELPDAVWAKILPHFGIESRAADRDRMRAAARFDAKMPGKPFANAESDVRRKQREENRATAEELVGDVYRRLEALRTGNSGGFT